MASARAPAATVARALMTVASKSASLFGLALTFLRDSLICVHSYRGGRGFGKGDDRKGTRACALRVMNERKEGMMSHNPLIYILHS